MKLVILFVSLLAFTSAKLNFGNYVVVANRGEGTVSFVNPNTLRAVNFSLPDGGDPMYFAFVKRRFRNRPGELWVGDRENNRLVILRLSNNKIRLSGFVPTPKGPFHTITNGRLVLTACDIDNVVVMHGTQSGKAVCKMELPEQVVRAGGNPHDVTADNKFAYVTFRSNSTGAGFVASYVARTCKLIASVNTSNDFLFPHVAIKPGTNLFITTQGATTLANEEVFSRSVPYLKLLTKKKLPSPHGIFISFDKKLVYAINVFGGGKDAVAVFRARNGKKLNCPTIDSSFSFPHEATGSFNGKKLYISHSIPDNTVNSVWDIDRATGCLKPESERIFYTGLCPFAASVVSPFWRL